MMCFFVLLRTSTKLQLTQLNNFPQNFKYELTFAIFVEYCFS